MGVVDKIVRPAVPSDARPVAAVLARAFADDQLYAWIFPDERARRRRLPRLFAAQLRAARRGRDEIDVMAAGGRVLGGAVWSPPGARQRPLPRFLPEFVMAQLESPASLARLAGPYRRLVVLITETGLRAGDACTLPSDTLITDSAGWPCLRVMVSKMGAEHLVPLSARAADAARSQQADLARDFQDGTPWLFPSARDPRAGAAGRQPPQGPGQPRQDHHLARGARPRSRRRRCLTASRPSARPRRPGMSKPCAAPRPR